MYHQYFGLRESPFSIAVNPRYLFMSQRHREALAHLLYGVETGDGFILLTGEVGTGKTTLNRCLFEQLPDSVDIAIVLNPALDATELLATVCDELGIARNSADADTLKGLSDRLHRFLLDNHARGRKTVLMIDEAQHLSFAVLEQIRLLTNLETHSEKLLHIILIGQPELAETLRRPELRQLNQRITARFNLEPLSLNETGAYIRHRLQVAGLAPGAELFPPAIVRGIYRHTRGIPRLINLLCDRMLLGAYGRNARRVDGALLRSALREVTGDAGRSAVFTRSALVSAALLFAVVLLVGAAWWALLRPMPVSPPAAAAPSAATASVPPATPAVAGAALPPPPAWLLRPARAERGLWQLYSEAPMPPGLCSADYSQSGTPLRCERERALSWEPLLALAHPLVLELITEARLRAAALVLELGMREALLATEHGVERVALSTLAPLWTGGYHFLWAAPPAYEGVLREGQSGPAVAWVAQQFARLDAQPQALTGGQFTTALRRRVELFQRSEGLQADGLIGPQTLQRLNVAMGEVPAGRQRWLQVLGQGAPPAPVSELR